MGYKKLIIVLFIVGLCLSLNTVSAIELNPIEKDTKIDDLKDIIVNDTLKDDLRDVGYIRESNDELLTLEKFVSYDSTEKELFIEDSEYKPLMKIQLLSDYTTYVCAGDDVKVAEFLLIDYDTSIDLFDDIYSFDIDSDYVYQERNYTLKYGEDYVVEICQDLLDFEEELEYCQNVTDTNWTVFTSLSELPHKNIKIGLFTTTVFGDNIEWIPSIHGFDIVEWADWDVTSGTKHEFDTDDGKHNSLVKINDTHYLNTYSGLDGDGYAIVLVVDLDTLTITNGTAHEFDTVKGEYNSLVKINDTHYLNTYRGTDDDGYAVVLIVDLDTLTITSDTKHEFDIDNNYYNSLVKINDTHYLNTYLGSNDNDGTAVVLTVDLDTLTISSETKHNFDTLFDTYNSLVKINDTHYLNTYRGVYGDGFAIVLVVDLDTLTITNSTTHEFDTNNGLYNSLVKINDTHYLNTYTSDVNDGYAIVLVVDLDTLTITNGTAHEFDAIEGGYNSLVQIDSTHYLNTYYGGSGYDGTAVVLTVDLDTLIITSGTKYDFDTAFGTYNSLVKINDTHYLNTYTGVGLDGYAIVLTVEGDIPPRYFQNSTNSTYNGTDVLHALKWEDGVGLDTYIFSFDNGTGTLVNDSLVDISGTNHWSNVTKGVNHTVGSTIRWQVFANDTTNNWNETEIFEYTTTTNSAPTTTTPTLSPTVGYKNVSHISCNNASVSDADDDSITWYYQWYINGTEDITNQNITNSSYFKDDELICEIWADDGTVNSTKYNSTTMTILNSEPITTTPTLSPTIGYRNVSHISCNNASVIEFDGNAITWYYQWYINDTINTTDQNITNTSYFKDDQLICEIWADDGTVNSTKYNSSTMTILNSQPVISNVVIVPSPAETTDDLNVTYTYYDVDGDAEINTYFQWYINDAENESVRYLESGNTSLSDNIIISVKADDSTDNSTWLNSSSLTIGDTTKPLISITDPVNASTVSSTDRIDFNVSYTELHPDTCILEFNSINYTMTINSTTNECTVTLGNVADGTYDYYVWINDTSGNSNQTGTDTISMTYTASWYERTSGSGSSVPVPDIEYEPTVITEISTKIHPLYIEESTKPIPFDSGSFSVSNLDITPTKYSISFDCSNYNNSLCNYIYLIDPILSETTDAISFDMEKESKVDIEYTLVFPEDIELKTYNADIVITNNKGDTIILPIEYKIREDVNLMTFIQDYKLLLGCFLAFILLLFYIDSTSKKRGRSQW